MMTTFRILTVYRTDGTSYTGGTEEDTARGRETLSREAFRLMAKPDVLRCETQTTTRHTKRKGTTR